jgi:hypothetical protein
MLFYYGIEVIRTPKGSTLTISNRLILPMKTIPNFNSKNKKFIFILILNKYVLN